MISFSPIFSLTLFLHTFSSFFCMDQSPARQPASCETACRSCTWSPFLLLHSPEKSSYAFEISFKVLEAFLWHLKHSLGLLKSLCWVWKPPRLTADPPITNTYTTSSPTRATAISHMFFFIRSSILEHVIFLFFFSVSLFLNPNGIVGLWQCP